MAGSPCRRKAMDHQSPSSSSSLFEGAEVGERSSYEDTSHGGSGGRGGGVGDADAVVVAVRSIGVVVTVRSIGVVVVVRWPSAQGAGLFDESDGASLPAALARDVETLRRGPSPCDWLRRSTKSTVPAAIANVASTTITVAAVPDGRGGRKVAAGQRRIAGMGVDYFGWVRVRLYCDSTVESSTTIRQWPKNPDKQQEGGPVFLTVQQVKRQKRGHSALSRHSLPSATIQSGSRPPRHGWFGRSRRIPFFSFPNKNVVVRERVRTRVFLDGWRRQVDDLPFSWLHPDHLRLERARQRLLQ